MQTINQLFNQGKLSDALHSIEQGIKKDPTDLYHREVYVEMLCITGELERADKQLEVLIKQAPKGVMEYIQWRQLIRAEQKRIDWYQGKALPGLLESDEYIEKLLKLNVEVRAKELDSANTLLNDIEISRPVITGSINQHNFNQIRDVDDLCSSVVEVLASNGDFYWVGFHQLESLVFEKPERFIDMLWRKASIQTKSGTDGVVFIPTTYHLSDTLEAKMGKTTEWDSILGDVHSGSGQRLWLFNDQDIAINDVESLTIK